MRACHECSRPTAQVIQGTPWCERCYPPAEIESDFRARSVRAFQAGFDRALAATTSTKEDPR